MLWIHISGYLHIVFMHQTILVEARKQAELAFIHTFITSCSNIQHSVEDLQQVAHEDQLKNPVTTTRIIYLHWALVSLHPRQCQ